MVLRRAGIHGLLAGSFALAGPACRGDDPAGRCDLAAVEQARAAMDAAAAAWTPSSGKLPRHYAVVIEALWRACPEMPRGFRSFLDLRYTHSRPQWSREGLVPPEDAEAPMEAILPGHRGVHEGYDRFPIYEDPAVLRVEAQVCPRARSVFDELYLLPADRRGPALFDGCDLGRFGLYARDEAGFGAEQAFSGLLLTQWLIATGVPKETADAIGRTLALQPEDLLDTEIHDLPHVASGFSPLVGRLPERVLLVSPTGIDFRDAGTWSPGSGLPEGEAVQWTYEHLRREMDAEERRPDRLAIVGDPKTPWSVVALGVAAARAAGHSRAEALVLVPSIGAPLGWVALDAGVLPTDPVVLRISASEWQISRAGVVTSVTPGGSLTAALAGASGVLLDPAPGLTLQAVLTAAAALGAETPRRVRADPPAN